MSIYDEKPWLARYAAGQPADIEAEFDTALDMFAAAVARNPDGDIIRYFDGRITPARAGRADRRVRGRLARRRVRARRPGGHLPAERARSS